MYSFDHYSDFPQQQSNFLPNLHNSFSPCNLNYERMNPFHQYQNHLPSQMGNFLPQTLHQDSNPTLAPPNNDLQNTYSNFPYHPNAPYERFTCNQASLGQSSPKKDRHTKISTAQGVRDRRVRLSMAIAREFFDLQDMLGFDKASNTIEWLLAKSKGAIHELILKKHGSGLTRSNSSSSSSYEEEVFSRRRRRRSRSRALARRGSSSCRSRALARRGSSSCKSLANDNYSQEEIEKIIVENQVNCSVARENRAKARARARERTKEKLSTMAKLIQFDELGLQTSGKAGCSSQFLMDNEGCNAPVQNLNGLNVIRSQDSSPSISTDYLQNLLSSSYTGDQDGSARISHPPYSLLWSNYNPEASVTMCSSSFELEHLHFSK